jgi:hypothetical protein
MPDKFEIDRFEAIDDSMQIEADHLPVACAILSGAPNREWQQFFLERARQLENSHPGIRLQLMADRLKFHTRAATAEESCSAVVSVVRDTNKAYTAVRSAENRRAEQRKAEVKELGKRLKEISKKLAS